MGSDSWLRAVEFVFWVVAATVVVVAVVGPVTFAAAGLTGVKYGLFVVGFLMFGVGSFAIQPEPPDTSLRKRRRLSEFVSLDGTDPNRLELTIARVPPLRGRVLPFERRVGRGPKVFVTSLVVLGVSLVMEFYLGVGV